MVPHEIVRAERHAHPSHLCVRSSIQPWLEGKCIPATPHLWLKKTGKPSAGQKKSIFSLSDGDADDEADESD